MNECHKKESTCMQGNSTVWQEIACHLPYAVVAVAFSLTVVSFVSIFGLWSNVDPKLAKKGAKMLFHSFHFMHLVFAGAGTLVTFFRFSNNIFKALLVGLLSPTFFCVLSDAVIPYFAGRMLGFDMHFHICIFHEIKNIAPFLFTGLLTGFLSKWSHHNEKITYALTSHTSHILVSSLASTFYLVAHGFYEWHLQIGLVFLFLIIAVVVPCTLSDVIVPMTIARLGKKDVQHIH